MIEDRLTIEFARLADADEIAVISKNEIEYGLGWKYTPARIARIIRDSSKNIVVARNDSKLIGFGVMTYREAQANLDLLAVKPGFRRIKVGTQIVQWLEKVALNAGLFNVFVQVRAGNISAIRFYQDLGFLELERDNTYYRGVEAGVLMAKSLRGIFVFDQNPP
ncbi:MAG: GNAT family N-acetyltransferase [Candidatus Thiodiazotropha sp.]